jgi:hypothetical protein
VPNNKPKLPLSKTHPKLAKEAYGWDPSINTAGSRKKVEWKCSYGHIWPAAIYSRASGRGCPYCSNRKVLSGFNDLSTTHPELAKEAYGWDPTSVSFGSESKKEWKCPIGHIYLAAPMDRARKDRGRGCPYCSHQKFLIGFNDLATTHPKIARLAHNWDPTTLLAGSREIREWKCAKGHITKGSPFNRTRADSSCPICNGTEILKGFNDLTTTHKLLSLEAYRWDPTKVSAGSNKKVNWKCSEGHKYESVIASRALLGNGCEVCSGQKVLTGYNDFATTHPLLAMEADGWNTKIISFGSTTKQWWKCPKGHRYSATPNSRTSGKGSNCPTCAKSGFDPNSDAYLYFLIHNSWMMLQIGITNFPEERLEKHIRKGWELLEIRGPMDGHLTQQWETAILRMLKAKGADLSNSKIAGKFDGYSEAWSKSTFPVKSIKELMRLTEEFEERN